MYQQCISQMKALEFRKRVLCDIVNNNICHYNISKWNPSSLNAIVILWREIWMEKIIIRKKHLFSSEKKSKRFWLMACGAIFLLHYCNKVVLLCDYIGVAFLRMNVVYTHITCIRIAWRLYSYKKTQIAKQNRND